MYSVGVYVFVCVCTRALICHYTCVEVRVQVEVLSLPPYVDPKDRSRRAWWQMLNPLTSLINLFKIWVPLNIKIWVLSDTNSRYKEFIKRLFSSSWDDGKPGD